MADNFNQRLYARGYSSPVYSRGPAAPTPQPNVCAPACATCGLLECLCRPRFFAGQLLTEQDLNRLDAYIRAKNRMHNLQLHGWGVVNGLQVRCDPCGSGVVVGTGYAIDPCGEDIVVCGDTPVDICALIKRCQPTDVTCVPSSRFIGSNPDPCDDLEEDWVLSIRYTETQARAITALLSTPSCACGAKGGTCTCGGNCATGNKMTSTAPTNPITTTTTARPRSAPTECEATAICEGYSFDVCLAPASTIRQNPKQLSGGLIDTFSCCLQSLQSILPQPPPPGTFGNYSQNPAGWTLWCCRMKEALIAFFSTGPQANCTYVARLQQFACPMDSYAVKIDFDTVMPEVVNFYTALLLEALVSCLCSALLPPAPCGTSDDRVPLAVVTVRKKDCRVLRVCDWTPLRKLVLTFPTLEYWFGWIPFFTAIREAIARACCTDFHLRQAVGVAPLANNVAGATQVGATQVGATPVAATGESPLAAANLKINPALDNEQITDNQTLTTLLMNAFARGGAPLDPTTLANGVFGIGSADTRAPLTATEKANVGPFLMLQTLLRPVVASAVPANLATEKPLQVAETVTNGGDETASLYTRVAALEKAIAAMGGKAP